MIIYLDNQTSLNYSLIIKVNNFRRSNMYPQNLINLSESLIQFYEKMFSWEIAVAKTNGLSPQQNHTIEIVGSEGSIRMKPLAQKLSVTTGTLTVMIDRLEKSGYLQRKNDPADGRAYNIELTQKGEEIHKEHHTYHLKLAEDINGLLEHEELNQLTAILKKINHSL
jgi:DNA-binding MarR family transcriptional regulator